MYICNAAVVEASREERNTSRLLDDIKAALVDALREEANARSVVDGIRTTDDQDHSLVAC